MCCLNRYSVLPSLEVLNHTWPSSPTSSKYTTQSSVARAELARTCVAFLCPPCNEKCTFLNQLWYSYITSNKQADTFLKSSSKLDFFFSSTFVSFELV
jgi:hypothetical protein